MSRTTFTGNSYIVSHTLEKEGPHFAREEFYRYEKYFTITWILSGKGKCFVEGNSFSLATGDAVLLPTNALRRFYFEQEGPLERITIYLLPSVVLPLSSYGFTLLQVFQHENFDSRNKLSLREKDRGPIWRILEEIKVQMDDYAKDNKNKALQDVELHLLILRLLVRLSRMNNPPAANDYDCDPAISSVCQYIQDNLSEKLTYQHIQENCKVSHYQLGVVFPRYTGMTLTEYVVQKRLIRVAELVMKGGKIENAAIKSGFQNYSYFYKAFIKYRGVSPKEYFRFLR